MVNYGFNKDTKGWKEEWKYILAEQLSEKLDLNVADNCGEPHESNRSKTIKTYEDFEKHGIEKPCIRIDYGLYQGVIIRHLTHLPQKELNALVKKATKIYCEVMGITNQPIGQFNSFLSFL
jgi:hypothetical protein